MAAAEFHAVTVKLIAVMLRCFPYIPDGTSIWNWAALVDSGLDGSSQPCDHLFHTSGGWDSPYEVTDTRQIIAVKQFSFLSDLLVSQIQMGWFQHDLGHCSVFRKPKWNRLLQIVMINMLKVLVGTFSGASQDSAMDGSVPKSRQGCLWWNWDE